MAFPRRTFLESVLVTSIAGAAPTLTQDDDQPPKFDFTSFFAPLRSKAKLAKITLNIPSNKNNSFGSGIFVDDATSFDTFDIDDKSTLEWIGPSFGTILRLFDGHTVGSYLTKGAIQLHVGEGVIDIEITQLGFCPAVHYPSDHVIFFHWPLAKLIDVAATTQSKSGLDEKYFSILSGEYTSAQDKKQYTKLFGGK